MQIRGFGGFLEEETFSVTLELKPTLEKEQNSLFWPRISVNNLNPAYFGGGTRLTVLEPELNVTEPKVEILGPSQKECRNKTLVCVASRFYPDHVTMFWQIDGNDVTANVTKDSFARRVGDYYRITSTLRVPSKSWFTLGKEFTCIVRFYNGEKYIYRNETISGIRSKEGAKYLRVSQTAKLSYSVFIIKSCIYGAFVAILVWKLQNSTGKGSN